MYYSTEVKEAAKRLFLRRCKAKEIQAQLNLPNIRIIYYWIRQGGWEDMLSDEEPLTAVGRRITLLLDKVSSLTKDELNELDRLTTVRERLLKQAVKPALAPIGESASEPQERRPGQRSERSSRGDSGAKKREKKVKNDVSELTEVDFLDKFISKMYRYQQELFAAKQNPLTCRIRNILKSRQVGLTYYFAGEAFMDAVLTGDNQVFLSANSEDYFEFGKLRLKTLQKGVPIKLQREAKGFDEKWVQLLWTCFGAQGFVALVFFFGSLFCEQIRARYQSFPFLEATGEAGAGKTTLLNLLWKLLGREGYEGFDPMKSTKAGRSRLMGQVSGMPVVFLEADRHGDDRAHAKTFEWDELKDFYGGGTLATKGVKTAGNETYEPPFRGTIAISQNAAVVAHEAIMTRIVKLHFVRPTVTPESRAAADQLNALDGGILSHFLLRAVGKESAVLELFAQRMPQHESKLRRLHSHCFACSTAYASDQGNCTSCGYDLRAYIRVERISKNHAQMLSLLDGIRLVLKLSDPQVAATQRQIVRMAIERQASISSDHAAVAEFWEVYDYLESLSEDPVVDHSSDPTMIAINLNEFCERAAEHKQKLAEVATLRDLLKESRSRKFLDSNKAVHSAVRAAFNGRNPCSQPRPTTVKCWTFKA